VLSKVCHTKRLSIHVCMPACCNCWVHALLRACWVRVHLCLQLCLHPCLSLCLPGACGAGVICGLFPTASDLQQQHNFSRSLAAAGPARAGRQCWAWPAAGEVHWPLVPEIHARFMGCQLSQGEGAGAGLQQAWVHCLALTQRSLARATPPGHWLTLITSPTLGAPLPQPSSLSIPLAWAPPCLGHYP